MLISCFRLTKTLAEAGWPEHSTVSSSWLWSTYRHCSVPCHVSSTSYWHTSWYVAHLASFFSCQPITGHEVWHYTHSVCSMFVCVHCTHTAVLIEGSDSWIGVYVVPLRKMKHSIPQWAKLLEVLVSQGLLSGTSRLRRYTVVIVCVCVCNSVPPISRQALKVSAENC